jgi:hypothetical protein
VRAVNAGRSARETFAEFLQWVETLPPEEREKELRQMACELDAMAARHGLNFKAEGPSDDDTQH